MLRLPWLLAAMSSLAAAASGSWFVDFEDGRTKGWHLPQPRDWQVIEEADGNHALRLTRGGLIGEPRRPVKFAVWEDGCVSDFELEVRVRREIEDMIVVFGYQDRLHFYYAHLSEDPGSHSVHNGLFRVDGGERQRIDDGRAAPALPTHGWHRVRVLRNVDSGSIEVFLDDERAARFRATDHSHLYGLAGVGSFNDTGAFDDFRLTGRLSQACDPYQISPLDVD